MDEFFIIVYLILPWCLLILGYQQFKKRRFISDIPTSKIANVFIGLVEIKGQSYPCDDLLISPLTETECIYYSYQIEEQYYSTDSKGTRTNHWKTIEKEEKRSSFMLRDDTGEILIEPQKAEVQGVELLRKTVSSLDSLYYDKGPQKALSCSTGKRLFTECVLLPDQFLYVIGSAVVQENSAKPKISYTNNDPIYLISCKSEEEIIRSFGAGAMLQYFFGFLIISLPFFLLDFSHDQEVIMWCFAYFLLFSLVLSVLYGVGLYNNLIDLKNRAKRAIALIDVELQRRHDLIPQLVKVVKAYTHHEKDLLESLTMERGRNMESSQFVSLAESYPTLKADLLFSQLTNQLRVTEDRLSMTRHFANEVINKYNTRIASFPWCLFAKRLQMGSMDFVE